MATSVDEKLRDGRMLRWALLLAWVVGTAFLVAHHETWRDEADTWLLARDGSVATVLTQASSYGAPALWQLILMPFAKAGLSIACQQWINWLACVIAVWLIVVVLELPAIVRLVATVSFCFGYEYAVVSRSYASGIALVLGALALWKRRSELAGVIGLLLALATNLNAHSAILAACVAVAFAIDGETLRRRRALALAVFAAGGLAAVLQVYPPGEFSRMAPTRSIIVALSSAVRPLAPSALTGLVGCVAVASTAIAVRRSRSALAFLAVALAGYAFLFQRVYIGFPRHHGFLFVAIIGTMAVCGAERSRRELGVAGAVVALAFLPSVVDAGWFAMAEVKRPYSGSVSAARLIERVVPASMPIAAHTPMTAESVLVHLDRPTFYYPAFDREGSYMTWDETHWMAESVSTREAIARAERKLGGRPYALLLDSPLPPELSPYFDVVGVEGLGVFSGSKEIFVVCIRRQPGGEGVSR